MTYNVIPHGIIINQLNKTTYVYIISIKSHRKGLEWHVENSHLCEGTGMVKKYFHISLL